jgi:hypothetical protein
MAVVRFTRLPPYYDRARLHQYRHHEAFDALAERFLSEPQIDFAAFVEGDVIAAAPMEFRVPLDQPTKQEFAALFKDASIGHISRSSALGRAFIEIGGARKLGREFSVAYVYTDATEESLCNRQWLEAENGRCQLPLEGNWHLFYAWWLP